MVRDEEMAISGEPFWRARSARRRPLLLAIGATVFVLAALLSAAAGLWGRAPTSEVRHALTSASFTERSETVTAHESRVTAAQRDHVDAVIARDFGSAPVHVARTTSGDALRWTVTPVASKVLPSDLAALQHGFTVFGPNVDDALTPAGGATTIGSGATTIATIAQAVQVVEQTIVVPLGILAVAGAVAVAMLGHLLVVARTTEDRLLRLRGASPGRMVGQALLEGVAVAVPSVIAGALVAQLALAPLLGLPVGVAEVAVPPLAALVLAVLALVATAVPAAVRPLAGDDARRRGASTVGLIAIVLVVLGAICTWRYQEAADAASLIRDPLALAAPTVVLCALAAVAAALLAPLGRLVAARLARGRELGTALTGRQIAQSSGILAAPVLLVALAVATGTLAAGATATSESFLDDAARLANGGAARITVSGDPLLSSSQDLLPAGLRRAASGDPSSAPVAPVLRSSGMISNVATGVVGVRASELPTIVPVNERRLDSAGIESAIASRTLPGVVLGSAATSGSTLTAALESSGTWATGTPAASAPTATITLWVVDPAGDAAPVSLPQTPVGGDNTLSVRLPSGGPWTVAAADVGVQSDVIATNVTVALKDLKVDGKAVATSSAKWAARPDIFGDRASTNTTTTIGAGLPMVDPESVGGELVRVMPVGPASAPVAISQSLADQTGLKVGDTTAVDGQVASFTAKVARIIPVVPGTSGSAAMLADLPLLQAAYFAGSQQPPTVLEAWTADPVVDRAGWGLHGVTITRPSTVLEAGFVRASATALWLAAAGAAAFAALTVAATVAALQRDRRPEIEVLRTLGVESRRQAGIRVAESGGAVAFALIAGGLAGMLATPLIAPAVARTSAPAAPDALPVGIAIDGLGLAILVGALAVAVAGLLAGQYRLTRRAAEGSRGADGTNDLLGGVS
ncbi:FtsX-like permease family protein [Planctomonas sp. JC2975]|uniref:FtsX-like permease family protein n=1 Tax=Planctomonas sp. JC2975 TaxID=2729626 RepID=UPI003211D9C8